MFSTALTVIDGFPRAIALTFHVGRQGVGLGTLLEDANMRHIFKRILEKAEIRQIRFHDVSHTFASLLIGVRQGTNGPQLPIGEPVAHEDASRLKWPHKPA